jgi:hypothetical protein
MTLTTRDKPAFLPRPLRRVVPAFSLALLLGGVATASDHADPIFNRVQEGGITDLFAFPAKDGVRMTPLKDAAGKQIRDAGGNNEYRFKPDAKDWVADAAEANELVLIVCVRRSLTVSGPFAELEKHTYKIHLDFHSAIEYEKEPANLVRYGGTVSAVENIKEDATIEFALNPDTTLRSRPVEPGDPETPKYPKYTGFPRTGNIRSLKFGSCANPYTGIHDDPFIFPQFFRTNVIAFVVRIPFDCLPSTKRDCVLWATSERRGRQVDHVGRSQRTQLPRFDLLNTLPPSKHVAALHESTDSPAFLDDFLRNISTPQFSLRHYDYQPDVMYYSRDRKPRYPNGRQLEDDVALLTCLQGDCQLFELSQSHPRFSMGPAGRPTTNDKEFSNTFPYLADPHPEADPPPPPRGPTSPQFSTRNWIILGTAALVLLLLLIVPWLLYRRATRRLRRANEQLAALRPQSSPPLPVSPTT